LVEQDRQLRVSTSFASLFYTVAEGQKAARSSPEQAWPLLGMESIQVEGKVEKKTFFRGSTLKPGLHQSRGEGKPKRGNSRYEETK